MTKELYEVLHKMKVNLAYKHPVSLNTRELSLVMKYIHELEEEISGGNEDND